ncbi:unnamed protein product [Musa textilis]
MAVWETTAIVSLAFLLSCVGNVHGEGTVGSIIPKSLFEEMLKHRNDAACPAKGFYTYDAFVKAASSFPLFGTEGQNKTRKRELAAFFAQTSHETTAGWETAPDGPSFYGYCYKEEKDPKGDFCDKSATQWPCAPGKRYYGISSHLEHGLCICHCAYPSFWCRDCSNYNYGQAGKAIHEDLLNRPELVSADPVISFKTAIWFWMTPQSPKPSCHAVMTGKWKPPKADEDARRHPGFGVTTNIINGAFECGKESKSSKDRIEYFKRYCKLLGVTTGEHLGCAKQKPFA